MTCLHPMTARMAVVQGLTEAALCALLALEFYVNLLRDSFETVES